MKTKIFALFLTILVLAGCASRAPEVSRPVIATLKTQSVALSETAFLIDRGQDRYRLQIYASGQAAYDLEVGTMICVEGRCMDRREFNARHLSGWYPQTLIVDVLAGRALRGLEDSAIEPTAQGFVQRAEREGRYRIYYEKNGDGVRFSDSHNRIIIAIKGL